MSNNLGHYELYLSAGADADEEELEQGRIRLHSELNDLEGVDRVSLISAGKAPEGTRAVGLVVIGGLALALKRAGVFDAVVEIVKSWIESGNKRKQQRKVIFKRPDGTMLEFDGFSLREIGGFGDLPKIGGKS